MHTIVGVLEQKCIPNRVDELVSNPLTWAAIKTTIKNDPELTAADKEFFRLFSRVGHMREVMMPAPLISLQLLAGSGHTCSTPVCRLECLDTACHTSTLCSGSA